MGILTLDDAPKVTATYIWADFLELHCLASLDNIASIDAAAKEAKSQTDNAIDTELFDDIGLGSSFIFSPEADDKMLQLAEEALHLSYTRSIFYGDHYPFIVDKPGKEICLREDLTAQRKSRGLAPELDSVQ